MRDRRSVHIAAPESRDHLTVASDYAFRGLPVRAHAGWLTLRVVNTGKETHMLADAPVPAGDTTSGFVDSLVHLRIAPNTAAAEAVGGVSSVHSGQRASVTVRFTPGVYLLFFAVDEVDPQH